MISHFRGSRAALRRRAGAMLLLAGALLLAAPPSAAQQPGAAATGVLTGRVTGEAETPIAGAAVFLLETDGSRTLRTVATDAAGVFRMVALPPGRYLVRAGFIGFRSAEREVTIVAGSQARVDLALAVAAVEVEAVEVAARRATDRERVRFETSAGVTARVVGGEELKILPGLAEADVLRAVELLPGVVSTSDFSSAFNVRGGSADQNLILLDGFPIFNPFHLGGLFSVFNPDMVARAELLAGGFGAEFGGRVSSVLNVESRVDAEDGFRGEGGISLLSSRLALRAAMPEWVPRALGGTGGSWAISARRSYFDQILKPVVDFPYHLTDVQAGAVMGVRGGGQIRFTGYTGEDVLDLSDFTPPGGEAAEVLRLRWQWGNDVAGIHWAQPVGRGWLADTRIGYSRYRDALGFADFDDTRFSSRISQLSFRADLARDLRAASVRTGVESGRLWYGNRAEAGGTEFLASDDEGVMGAVFATGQWRAGERWLVEGGLRADAWLARDTSITTLSPRFAAKRFFGAERDAAVKLSLGRYTQFLHSLRNEEFPLSNDIWLAADSDIPHVVSDQAQVGVEKFWDDRWFASLEAYVRSFRGVTEFNPAADPNDPGDDLLPGRGSSRGIDVLVRRTSGPIVGWTTVSLLQAKRTFPDVLGAGSLGAPVDRTFPPFWDRRVNINVVLQYQLPRGIDLGARYNFGGGLPYTRPVAQYQVWEYDLGSGALTNPIEDGDNRARLFVLPGQRNVQRYPAYQRLDVTVRRTYRPRWGTMTPYLQVLNVTNQRNVLFYFYNFDRSPPTRSGISMFPVLPTVGVEVTF